MTFRDLVSLSTGNLWRMKLRASLTISGVVIAIAAFVAMLSFGAGMQRNVSDQFYKLGLFTTMQVYPKKENAADTVRATLNREAVEMLNRVPGVKLAFPYKSFKVKATLGDTTVNVEGQALPSAAMETRFFSHLEAGRAFSSDSAREAVVLPGLLEDLGVEEPDSAVGRKLVLTAQASSLDSALANVTSMGDPRRLLAGIHLESLVRDPDYRREVMIEQMRAALSRFLDGYMQHRETIRDTVRIAGVLDAEREGHLRVQRLILPAHTAAKFDRGGAGDNPADLLAALQSGALFSEGTTASSESYPQVTLELDPHISYSAVKDSVEAMGFRAFSFAEQFENIRKFFVLFDLGLGVIGFIALIVASLGIVNTLVMSIIERYREIGVLKSLGADDGEVRLLFLAESGVIGVIGSVFGIVFGWLITEAASLVAHILLTKWEVGKVDLFALPVWLVAGAFAFGLLISLVAGLYPASRAARVDPVEALRND